jgi:hypothetical protein
MRSLPALLAGLLILTASAAFADTRVFIVNNQSDGYGIDRVSPRASAAARMPRSPIASRAISLRPPRIGGSIPTR